MKRAVAKCKQQDAPELELPPFRSSFKFVNMLMNSAEEMDQYKINKMFNFMKSFRGNQRGNYHKHSSSNQYDEFMEENVVSGEFGEVNVGQVKYFLRCYGGQHEKLCMDQDTRNKIEENYGPVEDMLEQTGWTEYQLLNAFRYMINQELNEF